MKAKICLQQLLITLFALNINNIYAQLIIGSATQEGIAYYTSDDSNDILQSTGIENPTTSKSTISQSDHFKKFTLDTATADNATFKKYLDKQGGIFGPSNISSKLGNEDITLVQEINGMNGKKYQLISLIDGSGGQGVGDLATVGFADQYPKILQSLLSSFNPLTALSASFQAMHTDWERQMTEGSPISLSVDPSRFGGATTATLTSGNYPRGGILTLLFDGSTVYIGGVTDSEVMIARNNAPFAPIGHASSDEWIGLNSIKTVNPQVSKQTINPSTDSFILLISDGVFKAYSKQMEIDLGKSPTEDQTFKKVYDLAQQIITKVGKPSTNEAATQIAQQFLSGVIDYYNTYFINKYGKLTTKYKTDDITVMFIFPQ